MTPLMIAAKHGWEDVALKLLKAGASLDHLSKAGKNTILHFACSGGSLNLVKALLAKGFNWRLLSKNGTKHLLLMQIFRLSRGMRSLPGSLQRSPRHCQVKAMTYIHSLISTFV